MSVMIHPQSKYIYLGIEGLKQALTQVLTLKEPFTYFEGGKRLFSLLIQQSYHWLQETEQLKIKGQLLLNEQDIIPLPSTVAVRYIPAEYSTENCTITCGDISIIISLTDTIQTTIIDDSCLTQILHHQFLFVWDNALPETSHLNDLSTRNSCQLYKHHYASSWDVEPELLNRLKIKQQSAFFINLQCIRDTYYSFKNHFPNFEVYYSIKSNSDLRVLKTLQQINSKFEAVAYYEIEAALEAGVQISDIIYSGSAEREQDITRAYTAGVRVFCVSSYVEIAKLAKHAPQAKLLLRVKTDDHSLQIQPSSKHGVPIDEACAYLYYIKAAQLEPHGFTFDISEQNEDLSIWKDIFTAIHQVIETANRQGFHLNVVNIGSSFPIPLHKDIPSLAQIGETVAYRDSNLRYFAEPGRMMFAEACKLVSPILSMAKRDGKTWLYIDAFIFSSLFMIGSHQFDYPITSDHSHLEYEEYTIASILCDENDQIVRNTLLPKGLQVNNLLTFHLVGAHSLPVFNAAYAAGSKIDTYYLDPCGVTERIDQQKSTSLAIFY